MPHTRPHLKGPSGYQATTILAIFSSKIRATGVSKLARKITIESSHIHTFTKEELASVVALFCIDDNVIRRESSASRDSAVCCCHV